jgi:cellulose synthase/poly-beta-1,6-N-acetylglucosamine synthase-like glycosyltransferase
VGKGYALDFCIKKILAEYADRGYEAYFVFDADNVLDVNYFREMNKTFDNGAKASTSYRNSKNYDSNWISAGYATWFLREAKFLNQARLDLNTSCAISGTGFFIAADIIEKAGGWKWHLLTEDIEFSAASILDGVRIAYGSEDETKVIVQDVFQKDYYKEYALSKPTPNEQGYIIVGGTMKSDKKSVTVSYHTEGDTKPQRITVPLYE